MTTSLPEPWVLEFELRLASADPESEAAERMVSFPPPSDAASE